MRVGRGDATNYATLTIINEQNLKAEFTVTRPLTALFMPVVVFHKECSLRF